MAGDQAGLWQSIAGFFSDQLQHVDWEGFRFYDLIFPLLIFVTGVSIVYSLSGLVEREGKAAAHLRVLHRAALLYVLGVIYYGASASSGRTFGSSACCSVLRSATCSPRYSFSISVCAD